MELCVCMDEKLIKEFATKHFSFFRRTHRLSEGKVLPLGQWDVVTHACSLLLEFVILDFFAKFWYFLKWNRATNLNSIAYIFLPSKSNANAGAWCPRKNKRSNWTFVLNCKCVWNGKRWNKNTIEKRLKLKSKRIKSICHVVCRHLPSLCERVCACAREYELSELASYLFDWPRPPSRLQRHSSTFCWVHICLFSGACIHHHEQWIFEKF